MDLYIYTTGAVHRRRSRVAEPRACDITIVISSSLTVRSASRARAGGALGRAAASATTAAKRPNAAVTPPSRPPTPPQALEGSGVALGAQDLYTEEKGAYTGATSIAMLKSIPNLQ